MEPRQQRYRQKMNFVLDKLPLERVKKDLAKLQGHQVVLFPVSRRRWKPWEWFEIFLREDF